MFDFVIILLVMRELCNFAKTAPNAGMAVPLRPQD